MSSWNPTDRARVKSREKTRLRLSAGVASSSPRSSAFLLIEALLALAIFSSAALVLTATFIATLDLRDRARNNDLTHADIQTARLQLLLEPNRDDAEDGGRIETLNSGEANWFAEIEPTNVVDLFAVRFTVEFGQPAEGQAAAYHETLHLLRPTWSDGNERANLLEDKKGELEDYRDFDRF